MELLIMISACKGGSANKITGMYGGDLEDGHGRFETDLDQLCCLTFPTPASRNKSRTAEL